MFSLEEHGLDTRASVVLERPVLRILLTLENHILGMDLERRAQLETA